MSNPAPSLDGFNNFVYNQMGVPLAALPIASPSITYAYDVAIAIANLALAQVPGPIYMLAVYNLGGSNLINFAPDQAGQTYFSDLRKQWNINQYVTGTVQSASDVTTSDSMVVPKAAENFTLADLQYSKDPFGRQYLQFAQRYGPTVWGMS